jgi:hypothetical protein
MIYYLAPARLSLALLRGVCGSAFLFSFDGVVGVGGGDGGIGGGGGGGVVSE